MRRDGNILSAVLRQAWDGDTLRTLTKGNPQTATDPHVALLAQITPEELRRLLEDVEFFSGFANRFLPIWSERERLLPFGSKPDAHAEDEAIRRVSRAVVNARGLAALDTFTAAGAEWWGERYAELTTGRPGRVGAATQRGAAQVRRLALLLSALDGASELNVPQLEAAFAIWRYAVESAEYVFGRSERSVRAQRFESALAKAGPDGMDRTAIRRDVFGSNNVRGRDIDTVLRELRDAGTARCFVDREASGRPREVWVHVRYLAPRTASQTNGTNGTEGGLPSHSSHNLASSSAPPNSARTLPT